MDEFHYINLHLYIYIGFIIIISWFLFKVIYSFKLGLAANIGYKASGRSGYLYAKQIY